MAQRKDGMERKAMLLEAATKVFAQKGFRGTTVADICQAAKSNTASVNYYFGSKEQLYAEVWKIAFRNAMEKYPPDMGLTPEAAPHDRLRAIINSLLHRMLDTGELGYAGQILLMEMANPTEAIELVKRDAIDPLRKRLTSVLRQLLGLQAAEQEIAFCAMSVLHQCMGFGFKQGRLPPLLAGLNKGTLIEALTNHITTFSLAGISAVRERKM